MSVLTPDQQHEIGQGQLLLDQIAKRFIREHLSYRFMVYADGAEALAVERLIRACTIPAECPYLNPL